MNTSENIETAQALIDNFELDKAKVCLEQLIVKKIEKDIALYLLGNIARREGKFAQAINFYGKALEVNPENKAAESGIEMLNEILAYRNTDLINP